MDKLLQDIQARAIVPNLCSLLLDGTDEGNYETDENYEEREKQARRLLMNLLNDLCKAAGTAPEDAKDIADDSLNTVKRIYFEIGVKSGVSLLFNLLR